MGVYKSYGEAFGRISILLLAPQVPKEKKLRKGFFIICELWNKRISTGVRGCVYIFIFQGCGQYWHWWFSKLFAIPPQRIHLKSVRCRSLRLPDSFGKELFLPITFHISSPGFSQVLYSSMERRGRGRLSLGEEERGGQESNCSHIREEMCLMTSLGPLYPHHLPTIC